ncbi:MAG: p-hydroxybenzoic acid efflux pump subunit AaeA [Wolbachia endosymbiont of Ctenocephalides orientis wCori]|nr:MAG: p-hydroxybenzoic acid efflux pump subunit AaeA [Wolbachia endosymbiont of Ctenocephalides orientis wCori]WCR53798.1 MAG: p-hydroxybenzoic acid efflux pump subunit AaeA [Wolbachia endosymbiont of Ctenocephalides orientis wCori]
MKSFLKKFINKFHGLKVRSKVAIASSIVLILLFLINSMFTKKDLASNNNTINSFSVKTEECVPQNRIIYSSFSGIVNPIHRASITSKINGKVTAVCLCDGNKVKKDDVVLKIEDDDKVEQIKRAKVVLNQRETEYNASSQLNKKGYRAQVQLEAAFTALQSAKTDLKRLELDLENTVVKSPIDGHIDKINANEGDFVAAGQKIAEVVDFDKILIVLYASENEVSKIKLGSIAQINLLDGKELTGEVSFISKIAESRTESYRVEIKVDNNEMISLQGLTANIKLPLGEKFAYKVPSFALSFSDEGVLGIKIVDDANYVVFRPVEIVDHDNDGVWLVMDNEDKPISLITLGHLFVKSGEFLG